MYIYISKSIFEISIFRGFLSLSLALFLPRPFHTKSLQMTRNSKESLIRKWYFCWDCQSQKEREILFCFSFFLHWGENFLYPGLANVQITVALCQRQTALRYFAVNLWFRLRGVAFQFCLLVISSPSMLFVLLLVYQCCVTRGSFLSLPLLCGYPWHAHPWLKLCR